MLLHSQSSWIRDSTLDRNFFGYYYSSHSRVAFIYKASMQSDFPLAGFSSFTFSWDARREEKKKRKEEKLFLNFFSRWFSQLFVCDNLRRTAPSADLPVWRSWSLERFCKVRVDWRWLEWVHEINFELELPRWEDISARALKNCFRQYPINLPEADSVRFRLQIETAIYLSPLFFPKPSREKYICKFHIDKTGEQHADESHTREKGGLARRQELHWVLFVD